MAWTGSVALSQSKQDAIAFGGCAFLGENVCVGATAEWHDGDEATDPGQTDKTDASYPVRNAWDGQPWRDTRATGTATRWWFVVAFPASVTFDCLYLSVNDLGATSDIQIDIDTASDFVTDVEIIKTVLNIPTGGRVIVFNFSDGSQSWRQLSGVNYFRIRFNTHPTVVASPRIGQLMLGRRRQLGMGVQAPTVDSPRVSAHQRNRGTGGVSNTYPGWAGAEDRRDRLLMTEGAHGVLALNDRSEMRALATDTKQMTEPLVYVPNPAIAQASLPHTALFGHLRPGASFPLSDFALRTFDLNFEETRPFFSEVD